MTEFWKINAAAWGETEVFLDQEFPGLDISRFLSRQDAEEKARAIEARCRESSISGSTDPAGVRLTVCAAGNDAPTWRDLFRAIARVDLENDFYVAFMTGVYSAVPGISPDDLGPWAYFSWRDVEGDYGQGTAFCCPVTYAAGEYVPGENGKPGLIADYCAYGDFEAGVTDLAWRFGRESAASVFDQMGFFDISEGQAREYGISAVRFFDPRDPCRIDTVCGLFELLCEWRTIRVQMLPDILAPLEAESLPVPALFMRYCLAHREKYGREFEFGY